MPFTSQTLHELLGHEGYLAGPLEFREVEDDGDTHVVLTGDYASWVGSWSPGELQPGQALREPRPLFPKLDPGKVEAEELERMEAAADAAA
jgi:methionyl-tRNA synthetase